MKLLVLLLLPCLSLSELVPGFAKCNQFFLKDAPPEFTAPSGTSVQEICQCHLDNNNQPKYLYATLYNTDWRIPIYSAYVFKRAKVDRVNCWYIEPQLDKGSDPWMRCKKPGENLNNQAMNDDYKGSMERGYNKGHLYPVQHTDNTLSMLATSTLTNAAPQNADFNRGKWSKHETDIANVLESCTEAYVVTGVVPDKNIPKLKDRVTVSKYYWTATCCLKNGVYTGKAYFGPDQNNVVNDKLSITELQTQLTTDYKVNNKIVIFPGVPPPQGAQVDPCN